MPDIWQLLEQDAPEGCESVQDLYSWSLNYDAGKGPFALFLDLIGWTAENFGQNDFVAPTDTALLGYVEISKLAAALSAYADNPHAVREYADQLIEAESGE